MNFLRRKLTDSRWLDSVVNALAPPDAGGKVLTSIASGSNEGEWRSPSGEIGGPDEPQSPLVD